MLGGRFEVMRKQGNMFQAAGGSRPRALPHGGSGGSAGKQRHEPDPLRALLRCSPVTAGVNGGLQRCSLVVAGAGNGPMLAGEASRRGRPGQAGGAGGGDSGAAHQERQDEAQRHLFSCNSAAQRPSACGGARKSRGPEPQQAGPGMGLSRNDETIRRVQCISMRRRAVSGFARTDAPLPCCRCVVVVAQLSPPAESPATMIDIGLVYRSPCWRRIMRSSLPAEQRVAAHARGCSACR